MSLLEQRFWAIGVAVFLAFSLTCSGAETRRISLVRDGKSDYQIVIPPDAEEPEQFAAEELSRYLEEISGAKLPVITEEQGQKMILLGRAAPRPVLEELSQQPEDAFIIRTVDNKLILAGACPRATLYSVYTFLEGLGVGFPRPGHSYLLAYLEEPGPQEETIPKQATITLSGINRTEKPSFNYRAFLTFPMVRDRTKREIDWAAKNRFNWLHLLTNTDLSIWEKEEVRKVLMPEIRKRALHIQGIGHSFYAYIPPKKYRAQHLEYFAMMDGERRTEHQLGATLCVSNPEVVRVMAENMSAFLRQNPEIEIIDLWNNDGLGWCECPQCQKMQGVAEDFNGHYTTTTRSYLRFVNQVAGLLQEQHPKILVNALAYASNIVPDPETRPAENVIMGFAPWQRCTYLGSDDYYVPITEPGRVNSTIRPALVDWLRMTTNLYLYDYYSNRSEFFPIMDTVRKDYAYYKTIGLDKISIETFMWDEFNVWAYGRLAWDHTMPLKKIIRDFCRIAYRNAAEPMEQFHTDLERYKWEWVNHRSNLEPLLKEAEKRAEGDPTVKAKLERLAVWLKKDPAKSWPHDNPPPPLSE